MKTLLIALMIVLFACEKQEPCKHCVIMEMYYGVDTTYTQIVFCEGDTIVPIQWEIPGIGKRVLQCD